MVEEKRCDSLMLKWEEDLSDGLRVMLKSPMIVQGQEMSGLRSTSDCRNKGFKTWSHGPYTFVTAKERSSPRESNQEVKEKGPSTTLEQGRTLSSQAVIIPPADTLAGMEWKDLRLGGKKEIALK